MRLLEDAIRFLKFRMETPKMYGWFHIACLLLVVGLTILLVKKGKDEKKILLILSVTMLVLELYKQLSYSYNGERWACRWDAFPFQFCSVPMYVAFIASFVKRPVVRDALYMFLATYGLVAGIAVMLYPNTVYIREVMINIQTMVHHGCMVVMGFYLILTGKIEFRRKHVLGGAIVFVCALAIAFLGNMISYKLGIDGGLELFYISPYHTPQLPVFDLIYQRVPYIAFLVIYIAAFSLGSLVPFGAIQLVRRIAGRRKTPAAEGETA